MMADMSVWLLVVLLLLLSCPLSPGKKGQDKNDDAAQAWKKKDVRDYNDADLERLLDQWEESDEDKLEEDELPEWKREPPKIDLSQIDPNDPEGFVKMSKKGRTLMMFATVSGNPTEEETYEISGMWHSNLFNGHIEIQRYVIGTNRVLFQLKDGAKAWQVRDFLVKQERCEEVTIESQTYPGAGADKSKSPEEKKSEKSKSPEDKKSQKSKSPEEKKTSEKSKSKKVEL